MRTAGTLLLLASLAGCGVDGAAAPPASPVASDTESHPGATPVETARLAVEQVPTSTTLIMTSGSLPISVAPYDEAKPEQMPADQTLRPETCALRGGVVTATGSLLSDVPLIYPRVGAFLVLHVYGPAGIAGAPRTEFGGGEHATGHVWKDSLFVYGSANDPWTITVPVDLRKGPPASCEVGIERARPFFFRGAPQ